MFRTAVEKKLKAKVESLAGSNAALKVQLDDARWDARQLAKEAEWNKREKELSIREAVDSLRAEMQKRLVETDISRAEAVAKLEVYQSIDTKDEREHLKATVTKLVDAVATIGTPKIIGGDE